MSVTVNKIKEGEYKISVLINEINVNATIVPSCISITASGTSLDIEFAAALSGAEDTELDAVVSAHVKPALSPDISDLPYSDVDEGGHSKLSVHPSYKPHIENGTTYAVWAGCGDDVDTPELGGGDLLHFDMVEDDGFAIKTRDVKFSHANYGRVWIHEAYLKFDGGGDADFVSSDIMASAAIVQTQANLDLILEDTCVKPAAGGPGQGTHGFGASPTLIPRTFSQDGDWDFDGVNLIPNLNENGGFKICTEDTPVHRYVNKIPCYGSSPYFSMSSDETAEIHPGYFIRINVNNVSNTTWHLSVIMEIYRERTVDP